MYEQTTMLILIIRILWLSVIYENINKNLAVISCIKIYIDRALIHTQSAIITLFSLVNISLSVKLSTYILQNILSLSATYGSVGGSHSVPSCFVFPMSLRLLGCTISQEILYPR